MGYPLPTGTAFTGPFQPMRFEATIDECIVSEGEIPQDLAGGFYRNGPTWKRPRIQGSEPILGMDGMVQGLVIRDGRADFKNRWIRTPKYVLEEKHGRAMFELSDGDFADWRDFGWGRVTNRDCYTTGVPQGTNNVNIFPFAGQMVASGEQGGPPIGIDPITLETTGIVPWSTALTPGMHEPACFGDAVFTAHPKWDHETGTLYGWGYKDTPPYVTMHTVHPDGAVVSREIDAPYNSNAHDVWLTPEWVVMPFQPFINSLDRIDKGLGVFGWDPELPIVLALIPRDDVEAPIRYVTTDIPAEYVMHTMSANVVDNKLILDAPIFNRPPFPFEQDFADGDDVALFFSISKSHLGRWTLDLDTGKATTEQLSDRPSELPKVDERFYGKGYRWGYQVGGRIKRGGMSMNSLVVTDMHTLSDSEYVIRTDKPAAVLEATFAPRHADSPEGDGYIIVPVSWWADHSGEFQIFDTHDITQGPICRIELPFALGWTPHGHWMDFR